MLSCLCSHRVTHATTLAFINFRLNLLFPVKDKTRKTLLLVLSCLSAYQTGALFSVSSKDHLSSPEEWEREVGCFIACRSPHLQVSLATCWAESIYMSVVDQFSLVGSICTFLCYQGDSVDPPGLPGVRIPYNRANHPCLPTRSSELIKSAWCTYM